MQTLFIYWWNIPASVESVRRTIRFVTPTTKYFEYLVEMLLELIEVQNIVD